MKHILSYLQLNLLILKGYTNINVASYKVKKILVYYKYQANYY